MRSSPRWDIFCKVVDNFGDIGVCWRLARQLAAEHGLAVRLWVDDLASLARLAPGIDPGASVQTGSGLEVRHWPEAFPAGLFADGTGDVVIEAFACEIPASYAAVMAQRKRQPAWINLEYLSAENWVRGCHGLASPHPRLPLTKHFFFPGFFAGTGGLIRESGLLSRRDSFAADPIAQARFWTDLGLPQRRPDELRVSLFTYSNPAIAGLLSAWSDSATPILCLIPEGPAAIEAAGWAGLSGAAAGTRLQRGMLQLCILPFVEQERYDQLLWACDCNFVRGEDSFVRAQWAGRPLVWQIYPQREDVHWLKLDAFLRLHCADLPARTASAVASMHRAWNQGAGSSGPWQDFWASRIELSDHALRWAGSLAQAGDLASALVDFCRDRLQ